MLDRAHAVRNEFIGMDSGPEHGNPHVTFSDVAWQKVTCEPLQSHEDELPGRGPKRWRNVPVFSRIRDIAPAGRFRVYGTAVPANRIFPVVTSFFQHRANIRKQNVRM